MNVGYYPFENETNRYIDISKHCIENAGCSVIDFSQITLMNMKNIDCVILNWYESVPSEVVMKSILRIVLKMKKILILRIMHVKVITTFHNKVPHDITSISQRKVLEWFYKWLFVHSDRIIVLSNDSKQYLQPFLSQQEIDEKCFFIQHPNYIQYELTEQQITIPSGTFKLLFTGLIRPYKNIEILIDAVKELCDIPIKLRIAGNPVNDEYVNYLLNRCGDSTDNIEFEFRFIPEDELSEVLRNASIIVLPYDLRSSMNSGTVILSFSNARTVICPQICTLSDFDKNLFYSYSYNKNSEHKEMLKKAITKAYWDWKNSPEAFIDKGRKLYENVKTNNSVNQLTDRYKELFETLERE